MVLLQTPGACFFNRQKVPRCDTASTSINMPTGPADGIHLHGNLVDRRGQGYENDLHSIGPRDAEVSDPVTCV